MSESKTDAVYNVVDGLDRVAGKHSASVAQVALAWVRDRQGITSPIIGPRIMEQLEDNLGSDAVTLDNDDLEVIDGLVEPGQAVSQFYIAEFGPHGYRL